MAITRSVLMMTLIAGMACLPAQGDDDPFTAGLVTAVGFGTVDAARAKNPVQAKLLAKRAAITDAQRNLLESIEGVRVTSGTTVKDAQLESDVIANRVKGLLKGAFVVSEESSEMDGTWLVQVTMGVCVNASIADCTARPKLSDAVYDTLPKTEPGQRFAPAVDNTPDSAAAAPATPASGLIVDLTGMSFSPYFDVRLVTEAGKEVYGPSSFDPSQGGDWVHWARSMAAAERSAAAGSSPMIVSATAVTLDSDVVISVEDAERLYAANREGGDFLGAGRVIFVLD